MAISSPQLGNAARLRIPVIARVPCGFHQLVDDRARRRAIGIPHAEIDHVDLRGARLGAHLIDDGENVRRQLLNAVVLFGNSGITSILRRALHRSGKLRFHYEALRGGADIVERVAGDQVEFRIGCRLQSAGVVRRHYAHAFNAI